MGAAMRWSTAIEENVAEALMAMGEAGGGEQRTDPEVRWTVGGSPIDYQNAVVDLTVSDARRARRLAEEFVARLHDLGVPGSWHLHPGIEMPGLADVLLGVGFTDGGTEPAMALELSQFVEPEDIARDLVIRRVANRQDLGRYQDVLGESFGEGPREADWVASIWDTIGFDPEGRWQHFVAFDGGDAVSTATTFRNGPLVGVYFVATRPSRRANGYGAAITARSLAAARVAGAELAILGSSPMGRGVYERLGFRECFTYRIFEYRPPG